ncbi:hypothetical+protein [Methylocapsa aurea]|uniref:PepSY-associated TM helix domain-containing protein n=1 Tax=Methylocapsa aurea TaxID=663610 RepID=UPI003D18ABA3
MSPRAGFVFLHRWIGLAMTAFLILVGLTGSILAFQPQLNHWLTPDFYPGPHAGAQLDPAALALRAEALFPRGLAKTVYLGDEGTATIGMAARPGAPPLGFNQLFLDPVTGEEMARRQVGGLPDGWDNLMPFIYRLHYNLAIGPIGRWTLGIVALAWTIDCFIGFYLTLPRFGGTVGRGFFTLWKTAWLLKLRSSAYRINFDLHRAAGLWLWVMLLVFAWSSVSFNLKEVYDPAMRIVFDYRSDEAQTPARPGELVMMDWAEAQISGRKILAEQALLHGFTVERPIALYKLRERGLYEYRVRSSRDLGDQDGRTSIFFDAFSGELRDLRLPTGKHAGNTITAWLHALHMAKVFGLPYRIFVCALGFAIAMLSVTGVYIWSRKRRAQRLRARHAAVHVTAA